MKNLLFILLIIPFIGLGQNIIIPVFANGNNQERVNYWKMVKSYPKYNILIKREMGPVSTGTKLVN